MACGRVPFAPGLWIKSPEPCDRTAQPGLRVGLLTLASAVGNG